MTARELDDALLAEALSYNCFVLDPSDGNRRQWQQCRRVIDAVISGAAPDLLRPT
jgi:hypothetical protein